MRHRLFATMSLGLVLATAVDAAGNETKPGTTGTMSAATCP